jgi:hypothetical protein
MAATKEYRKSGIPTSDARFLIHYLSMALTKNENNVHLGAKCGVRCEIYYKTLVGAIHESPVFVAPYLIVQ